MLNSSKLVLGLGCLLGASVAILPTRSFAGTKMIYDINEVSVEVDQVLSLAAVEHTVASASVSDPVAHPGSTYNSVSNTYYATLLPGIDYSSDDLATTKYRVVCNYLEDCRTGWTVTAAATSSYRDNGYAVMTPASYTEKIVSNGAKSLDGSAANWLIKLSSDDVKTVNGVNYPTPSIVRSSTAASPSPVSTSTPGSTASGTFVSIPASPATVISGVSVATINGIPHYFGPRYFSVTYGFSAAANTTADTYTGEVEYILSASAS